jgi:hypothetical protein
VLQEKVRCSSSPDAVLATAERCTLAAGTRVAVSRESVTNTTVSGGGAITLSPLPQDPISHASVIELIQPEGLFVSNRLFVVSLADTLRILCHTISL